MQNKTHLYKLINNLLINCEQIFFDVVHCKTLNMYTTTYFHSLYKNVFEMINKIYKLKRSFLRKNIDNFRVLLLPYKFKHNEQTARESCVRYGRHYSFGRWHPFYSYSLPTMVLVNYYNLYVLMVFYRLILLNIDK